MARALGMMKRLRPSDDRVRIATISGVSVLVAVIALLIGVLPVFAGHTTSRVTPIVVSYGGGPGACSANIEGRLPSAAANELHINNPVPGMDQVFVGTDGTEFEIDVYDRNEGRLFAFTVLSEGIVVYDVVVNGGPQNNHYDYDGNGGPGAVEDDQDLHAPRKNASKLHNLSHINICYDVPGITLFLCDTPVRLTGDGLFTIAEATIFANSVHDCSGKRASFFIDNEDTETTDPTVALAFAGDGTDTVAGRLDVTKNFESPPFDDLEYDGPGSFVDLQWCAVRAKDTTPDENGLFDGNEFDDVLDPQDELAPAETLYPSLVGVMDGAAQATACKVHEGENAAGIQFTVVYFEFEDPQFR